MKNTIITLLLLSFGVCNGQQHQKWDSVRGTNNTDSMCEWWKVIPHKIEITEPIKKEYDTIKVLCQVSDTAAVQITGGFLFLGTGSNSTLYDTIKTYYKREVEWWYLYSVRKKANVNDDRSDGRWCLNCPDYWKHICYLDENKRPLPKNIVIWQSLELSGSKESIK